MKLENVGAWILGRNMFGPVRGPWLDDDWKGTDQIAGERATHLLLRRRVI